MKILAIYFLLLSINFSIPAYSGIKDMLYEIKSEYSLIRVTYDLFISAANLLVENEKDNNNNLLDDVRSSKEEKYAKISKETDKFLNNKKRILYLASLLTDCGNEDNPNATQEKINQRKRLSKFLGANPDVFEEPLDDDDDGSYENKKVDPREKSLKIILEARHTIDHLKYLYKESPIVERKEEKQSTSSKGWFSYFNPSAYRNSENNTKQKQSVCKSSLSLIFQSGYSINESKMSRQAKAESIFYDNCSKNFYKAFNKVNLMIDGIKNQGIDIFPPDFDSDQEEE